MEKRPTIRHIFLGVLLLAGCARETVPEQETVPVRESPIACMTPAFLEPGDKIALLTPAYTTPMENVDSAAAVLRSWGFEPVIGPNVGKTFRGDYAGTPAERVSDLRWALSDPSIKAILCIRGGYGTIRFVDLMTEEDFSASPKWLVGYSDISTLHEMETRSGVMSIHGAMGNSLLKYKGEDPSSTMMRDLLLGNIPEYTVDPHPQNIPGTASGILVGGNLCTITPLLGTWADATAEQDFILFIEEVEENMSHIDRLMNTLIFNGIMERCKGVVLGEFTDCEANLEFDSVEQMLCSYLDDYGIPVCCGFPAGHDKVNLPLVMGAPVSLTVTDSLSTLRFHVDGFPVEVHASAADTLAVAPPTGLEVQESKAPDLVRVYNFLKYYSGAKAIASPRKDGLAK